MAGLVPRELTPATATAVTDGGATETVVLTSAGVSTPGPNATVELHGVVNITTGTGGTAVVVNVRRGATASGTEVGTATTDTSTAGDKYTIPFSIEDTPGDVAGLVYSVTVTETGASADGTVNYAVIGGIIS